MEMMKSILYDPNYSLKKKPPTTANKLMAEKINERKNDFLPLSGNIWNRVMQPPSGDLVVLWQR